MLVDLVVYIEDDFDSHTFVGRGAGVNAMKKMCERRSRSDVKIRWSGEGNEWIGTIPGKPSRYHISEAKES